MSFSLSCPVVSSMQIQPLHTETHFIWLTHECRPANPSGVRCLSMQQIQPREHRALHRRQPEHPATFHPAGADDRRRHEELPETEQATSCTSVLHLSMCARRRCVFVWYTKLSCAVSRARPLVSPCGSCCGWPETSPLAVATWRRTTSYTGSDPHPVIAAKSSI